MTEGRFVERVREEIRRELSAIVEFEAKDPVLREAFPTVMDVRLSPDLRYAKVYVALGASDADPAEVLAAFKRDRGFLRTELARRLELRYTPDLGFLLDEVVERAMRVDRLLEDDDVSSGD
jgi:ribosome-binding factor A